MHNIEMQTSPYGELTDAVISLLAEKSAARQKELEAEIAPVTTLIWPGSKAQGEAGGKVSAPDRYEFLLRRPGLRAPQLVLVHKESLFRLCAETIS